MVYTHKSPALLVIGIVILLWGWLNQAGSMDGLQAWLQPSAYKEQKQALEKHQAAEKAAVEKAAAEGKSAPEAKPMKPGKFDAVKAKQAQLSYIVGGLFAWSACSSWPGSRRRAISTTSLPSCPASPSSWSSPSPCAGCSIPSSATGARRRSRRWAGTSRASST
ncbi:MAG: hypothetical protein M5R42_07770 [Rhodocyclaceae bacterium]|nr:hypothetical protein [Rhodocyclaceae bacterium]